MGKSYSVVCKCNSKDDEETSEAVFNSSKTNFDQYVNEKTHCDNYYNINNKKSKDCKFIDFKSDLTIEEQNNKILKDSPNYVYDNTQLLNEKYKGYNKTNLNNEKDKDSTNKSLLKGDDPDFNVLSQISHHNEKSSDNNLKDEDKAQAISAKTKNTSFISSKRDDLLHIHQFIPEENLEKLSEFEVIYQGELFKYNFKISASFNHNVSYANRFCIFTKRDIRLYKSKESFLHLFPPINSFESNKINYASKINITNKKGLFHFSFVYDYPQCFDNPVFNEYYSSQDQSIVFKEIAKENKFYLQHKNFKLFCDHLVILASSNKEEIERWMAILRYCLKNN
jgi:hypothetical protein